MKRKKQKNKCAVELGRKGGLATARKRRAAKSRKPAKVKRAVKRQTSKRRSRKTSQLSLF